ncbi:MAG: tetratricopeptide repeat protein [Kiritimatiellae bacterium]|nr:tetratricopeptide repeat protein [Kiritimatiellia bacterium]
MTSRSVPPERADTRAVRRACAAALLSVLIGAACAAALEENEQLQFAEGMFSRGIYDMAIREYLAFVEQFPNSKRLDVVYYRIGECYRHLKNHIAAEKAYRRVFMEFPGGEYWAKAALRHAELFVDAGEHKKAAELLRGLIAAKPPADIAASAYYFLGHSLLETDAADEAAAAFETVVKDHASSSVYGYACLALGGIYAQRQGMSARAVELLETAAAQPGSERVGAEACYQLAGLYFREKSFQKSAETYARLFERYPGDKRLAEAALQGAWAYHNAGLYAKALRMATDALANAAIEKGGKKAEWLYLKANAERQLLKHDEAARTYDILLKQFPDSRFGAAAAYEKALAHFKSGQFRAAIEQIGGLNMRGDVERDAYWLLAESHVALEQDDEAIQYYRLLTDKFPETELAREANYRLADLLRKRGQFAQAASRYAAVTKSFPDSDLAPRALFASAFCLAKNGEHEKAARDWAELVRRYPDHALVEQAVYQKALSEIRLKRDAQAEASLRDLLARFPATAYKADAHYWLGLLYKEAGRSEEAESALRAALAAKASDPVAWDAQYHLAVTLHALKKDGEAAGLLQKVLATPVRKQVVPAFLEWLAEYRLARQEWAQAVEAAQVLVANADTAAWRQIGCNLLGQGHAGAGARGPAREALEQALGMDIKSHSAASAALRLGELLLAEGDPAGAAQRFEHASQLASDLGLLPTRVQAYVGLGRAARAGADFEAAARYFMSVAVLFDDAQVVPECLFQAAEAFGQLGRAEDKTKALAELLERYPGSARAKEISEGEGRKSKVEGQQVEGREARGP